MGPQWSPSVCSVLLRMFQNDQFLMAFSLKKKRDEFQWIQFIEVKKYFIHFQPIVLGATFKINKKKEEKNDIEDSEKGA